MSRPETLEQILKFVCDYFLITVEQAKSRDRRREFTDVRQLYIYLAKKHHLGFIHNEICAIINRDHATSVYSIKMVENRCQVDTDFNKKVQDLAVEFSREFQSVVKINKVKTVKAEKIETLREVANRLELRLQEKDSLILDQMQELEANRKELKFLRDYHKKTERLPEVLKMLNL